MIVTSMQLTISSRRDIAVLQKESSALEGEEDVKVGSRGLMPGAARPCSEHSDTLSVLDNYGLPPERIIVRFADDGEGWRNMQKRLSDLSLRGRRVLFSSKLALSPRQCRKHRQLIDCAVHAAGNCQRQSLNRFIRPNILWIERSKDDCLLKGTRHEPYVLPTLVPCGSLAPRA